MLHEIKVNVIFQEILQHLCAAAVNLQLLYCVRQRSIYRCSAVFLYGGGCVNRALWRRLCKRSIIRSMCFWVQEVCVSGCNLGRRPKTRWLTRCSQKSWRCPSANETHKKTKKKNTLVKPSASSNFDNRFSFTSFMNPVSTFKRSWGAPHVQKQWFVKEKGKRTLSNTHMHYVVNYARLLLLTTVYTEPVSRRSRA